MTFEHTQTTQQGWYIHLVKNTFSYQTTRDTVKYLWQTEPKTFDRLYKTDHSILEGLEFWLEAQAPRSVAMQLETHKKKYGVYFWMASARPDRNTCQGEYSREQLVRFVMKLTARGIKEIAHQRLCGKAEAKTREFVSLLKQCMAVVEPALADEMMPMCEYRNGLCGELKPCGHNKTFEVKQP